MSEILFGSQLFDGVFFFLHSQKLHVTTTVNNCLVLRCVADGSDHGDIYGLSGKSPAAQFSYPAFTFPGPQVSVQNVGLYLTLEIDGELESEGRFKHSMPRPCRSPAMPCR